MHASQEMLEWGWKVIIEMLKIWNSKHEKFYIPCLIKSYEHNLKLSIQVKLLELTEMEKMYYRTMGE